MPWGLESGLFIVNYGGVVEINSRDLRGNTALMLASEYGHEEVVSFLLNLCAIEADARDLCGTSALSVAASRNHTQVIKALISHHAVDVNSRDISG